MVIVVVMVMVVVMMIVVDYGDSGWIGMVVGSLLNEYHERITEHLLVSYCGGL